MKKIFYPMTAFILSLSFAACSGTVDSINDDTSSSFLSDPFENTISNTEVTDISQEVLNAWDILDQLSNGGYRCDVKVDTFQYDGSPMTFPVIMKADDDCNTDISIGISFYINGVPQKLSCGEDTDKTMIIREGIEPGKTVKLDVTLDPVISEEDAEKGTLPITCVEFYNPTFVAPESLPNFAFLRCGDAITKELTLNTKPENIKTMQIEKEYDELLRTSENVQLFYPPNLQYDGEGEGYQSLFQNDGLTSKVDCLKLDENGKLKFSLVVDSFMSGEYVFSVMKNNENVKFNNGKDYACVSIKDEHIYVIDFELENVKRGDVIQVVRIDLNNRYGSGVAQPYLVVDSDFVRK